MEKKFLNLNKKQWAVIIIGIAFIIPFANSFPISLKQYSNLDDNSKHFWTSIITSGIGLAILYAKKKTEDKEMCTIGELFEILMFVFVPMSASFGIFQKEIQEQPLIITATFLTVLIGWSIISWIMIHRKFHDKGDKVFKTVRDFSIILGGFGIAMTVFVMWIQSSIPK